jgi:AcrR family transcriptional regulator
VARVTQAHLDARRQQIIDAASACFARSGFHQATMQEICREAELSPGAVYRYFDSKDEIIRACCEAGLQRSLALLAGAEQRTDTLAAANEIIDAVYSELDQSQSPAADALNIELWAEACRNPRIRPIVQHMFASLRERLTVIFAAMQADGEINPGLEAAAAARTSISLFEGLVLQKMLEPELEIQPYVDVVKAMLTGGFWCGAAGPTSQGE